MTSSRTPAPARTLLVGYGKLGGLLAPRLRADGGEVFAVRRSDGTLPDGVIGIRADLSAPLPEPLPPVDAMVVTLPPSGPSGYRTALTHLAAALPAVPARTVFVSSTGVFEGRGAERPITEQDDPAPVTERAQELRDGERAAIDLFDAVIVRPAGIYGPGRDFLIRQVREHATVNHRRRTNRIHDADLVRALEVLLRMPEPPRVLHAVDAAPAPLGDVVAFIAQTLGLEVPPDDVSAAPTGTVLDGSLLRAVLGELEYPTYEAGYAAMLTSPPRSTHG
ncbi:sugar nucleotide-binding protein [Microbacterium saperdae]|uniref:Nucleoside-diphosphate-sugar epimerase n=1 Tax=Microbacterium saperdae TaxID=69368 RepID=A0A543B9T3_9MICO|nr:sugar nucleotide-binding protein [Microbacterium saperdae]TQL81588.1 nucleoside-diphosphate-sugar epimerase [Microbacterium saperdae]GGM59123.1 NAD(P)-dependent oxidoreductase [Microbacterium saperdae]